MKIITKMLAEDLYEAVNPKGNRVSVDMRKPEDKAGLSPTELLLSALAGCGAIDIVIMLKKRKKSIDEFVIETDGTRMETPPRYFSKIHCKYIVTSPDVTEDELYKTAGLALEKYCSVASSIKSEITYSVEVVRP